MRRSWVWVSMIILSCALGVKQTVATGINAAGQIVVTFPALSAAQTVASGINAAGQIVGDFKDAGRKTHGYLRTAEGTSTTIDAPGAR